MIDIKFLRENPDVVKENIRRKFQDEKLPLVDEVIALDAESRKAKQEADDLRANRNKISKEIGTLMAHDALDRAESCGGHFRTEHQTEEGEALRHDDKFMYVSCWEYQGDDKDPVMLKEPLNYEFVVPQTRNYKK